jgi:2-alkenal reductase
VVTNFHVVQGAASLAIVLATGEERPARIVGDDSPFADLAVLAVPPQGLRSATLGDSAALRIGDPVVAVTGGAITPGNAATVGVVSGTRRAWARPGVILEDLVQTDAAVNSGDSGGALVDLRGEVVGILTTVVRDTPNGRAIQGVSFAQSSNSLRVAIESIARTGSSLRPRLGIERFSQHIEVTPTLAQQQGLPVEYGALVTSVAANSPAAAAGLRAGDIVVGMNGVPVDFENPLVNLLKRLRPGENADLLVVREGAGLRVTVTPRVE